MPLLRVLGSGIVLGSFGSMDSVDNVANLGPHLLFPTSKHTRHQHPPQVTIEVTTRV